MEKYKLLIKRLHEMRIGCVEDSIKELKGKNTITLKGEDIIIPSLCYKEYEMLKSLINTEESLKAYSVVIDNLIKEVIHTILVMFDNGDALADHFIIDIIDYDTKKSITENIALHEEFMYYLNEIE